MDLRYWDACAFIAVLNKEEARLEQCMAVLEEARRGRVVIATSAVTLTEVVKQEGERPIGRENAQRIRDFFKHEYISVRDADRATCELAQNLIWDHPHLDYKDAIHVATAVRWQIPIIETFDDDDLLPLNGQIGDPPIIVRNPIVPQGQLFMEGAEDEEEDE